MLLTKVLLIFLEFLVLAGTCLGRRVCSKCFHIEVTSREAGAKLPETTTNRACLNQGDDFTHHEVIECESGVEFCRKVVGSAIMMYNGVKMKATAHIRECGATATKEGCMEDDYLQKKLVEKGAKDVKVKSQACYCQSDYCNLATSKSISTLPFLLTIMFSFFFQRL